ncbi:MAG: pyridoxamine 5'-phosphate oxidase family protein [Myxococcota bacterium]|nr:pyridoxamine 5'-phosphate oxidase family protein [Myxococcota bacterium]
MDLKTYFEEQSGLGILSTADAQGRVNAAVYARPHVQEDGTVAFIMANRVSKQNLTANPHASFLFKEDGPGYRGTRLTLTKIGEEEETERLRQLLRRSYSAEREAAMKPRSLVFFRVDDKRPLVGTFEEN